jgi:mono/diheme cytochrome c family protein
MKIGSRLLVAIAAVAGTAATIGAAGKAAPKAAPPALSPAAQRGKYLVSVLACNDCHTPKKFGPDGSMQLDMTKFLSGYVAEKLPPAPPASGPWMIHANAHLTAWAGPWGVSYTKNLTPDENTGIGSWSEETFMKAIRTGKHMGVSRPILPPMPWEVYKNLTDADLKAVYAYLRTIPAVHNPQPEPAPPAGAPAGKKP